VAQVRPSHREGIEVEDLHLGIELVEDGRPSRSNRSNPSLSAHRKHQLAERLAWGPAYKASGDFVFCREDGSPLHPDDVSKRFASAVAALDVPRITLHGLRHTWASLALQAEVSPKVVSERLGHASVSFTLDVYSHVMPEMQEDAARVARLVLDA
jgi:integrase